MKTLIRNSKNILYIEDYSKVHNSVTITVKDNKLTMVGTATNPIEVWIPLKRAIPAGTYISILGQQVGGAGFNLYISKSKDDYKNRVAFVNSWDAFDKFNTSFISTYFMIYIRENTVIDISSDLMLNEGSTALPYEHPNKISKMKMLINENENLAKDIPNRIDTGESQFGQRGFFESKNGVITFGGVLTVDSLQATYNVISQNTWVANYSQYYRLTKNDLDIFPGTYTISMKVTAGAKHTVSIVFGDVGTYEKDTENTPAKIIYLKQRDQTKTNEFITQTFTIDRKMKFALLANAVVDAVGEDTGTAIISDIILSKGTLVRNPKNLIPFPYETGSIVKNGLTFTVNNDGTIFVNGKATEKTEFTLIQNVENFLVDGQIYYFKDIKGADKGLSNAESYFTKLTYVQSGKSTQVVDGRFTYNKATFSPNIFINIRIANGFTCDNLLFKPMLNKGTTAEPYFVPQKITKMKPLMRNSKNLFNEGAFLQLDDVSIDTYEGEKCYKLVPTGIDHRIPFFAKAGDKITLSLDYLGSDKGLSSTIMFEDTNGNSTDWWGDFNGVVTDFTTRTKTITLTKDCAQINFRCFSIHTYKLYYFKNIMLNIGTTALPYEPYNKLYNDSSISVRNPKNLIPFPYYNASKTTNGVSFIVNSDCSVTVKGTATSGGATFLLSIAWVGIVGNTYTVSGGKDGCAVTFRPNNGAVNFIVSRNGNSATGVLQSYNSKYSYLGLHVSEGVVVDTTIYPVLNEGTTAEPYFTSRDLIIRQVSNVPSGYQEVEYLESTGTQYIDTELKVNNSVRMIHIGHMKDTVGTYDMPLCGVRKSSELDSTLCIWYNTVKGINDPLLRVIIGGKSSDYKYFTTDVYNENHTLEVNNKKVYFDNEAILSVPDPIYTETSTGTLPLFALRTGSTIDSRKWRGVTKKVILYMDDKLVRNFIPCYRKRDKVAGLYDTVSGKFFTNSGTGEFITGLPKEYQEVEYLESTGTQYIDTEFHPTKNTKIIVEATHTSNALALMGSEQSSVPANKWNVIGDGSNEWVAAFNGNGIAIDAAPENDFYKLIIEPSKYSCTYNGVTTEYTNTITSTVDVLPYSLYLFAKNGGGVASRFGTRKMKICKIYDNNILIRDFIPCYRKKDSVAGMYDIVTKKFFVNKGTGKFITGDAV